MTLVRKFVIVLVGVSLAVLVTVLLLNPQSVLALAENLSETSALIRLPLAILVDVIVLVVIIVLVRSERTQHPTTGLMVKAQGAIADVSIESARDRILRVLRDVPDVLSAEASVKAIRGKADVDLDVVVSRESTNLPEKQREIDRALRQVINKQLGLQMAGKPRVHIRMEDERLLTPLSEAPAPAPIVVTAPVVEPVVEPEVKITAPSPADSDDYPDAVTLRGEGETATEAIDPPLR